MKSHVRAVVIGGGVVGCSVLYHLSKLGWRDIVLCERKELTAGSSWHAAGGFHALNSDANVSKLQAYTVRLYREIERLSGQDIGLHFTGGLNVAATRDRWELLRADWARHRVLGLETQLLSPTEIRDMCPLIDVTNVIGALYDPMEGHLDPYGATHAFAKAAGLNGAEIYRHTKVEGLTSNTNGSWTVVTDQGTILADHVINAGGLWAREVGQMAGVDLPIVAMEHHYLLTEDLPEIVKAPREMPLVLDLDGEIYLRQERKGVLLGVYEKDATPWALNGTPWDYGATELLPPNLDRLTDSLQKGFRRFPRLSEVGIRKIVNGPFTFSPDGNPLVGPVSGLRNYWVACGVMAGFAQGGGVGLALAQWMVNGEPDDDIFAMDVARFGSYATRPYSIARAREFYAKRFQIAYPNETWPAGRPSKTSAVHSDLLGMKAVFGVSFGQEVPLFFATDCEQNVEIPTVRRSNAFSAVRSECLTARRSAGLLDVSSFGKYRFSGPRAAQCLDYLLAGKLPMPGQIRLTPMLSPKGKLMGDLSTMCLSPNEFWISGSGYLQEWHMRWFSENCREAGVLIENISDQYGGFSVFGPEARAVLQALTNADLSNEHFKFMTVRRMPIGVAPAIVGRLSVTGELGYEIYVPRPHMTPLLDRLAELIIKVQGCWIGMYAVNSLRLEKSFGIWSREFSRDYTPRMANMARYIDFSKPDFIGRELALLDRDAVPTRRLVTLTIDASDSDATGYEPIYCDDRRVGYVTSGGFGHCANKSIAMGYLETALPVDSDTLSVMLLGHPHAAQLHHRPLIDPEGARMRA
jgi:dimethylglycine dehydrogenase